MAVGVESEVGAWYPELPGDADGAYLTRQLTTATALATDLSRIDRRGQLALRLTPVHGETARLTLDGHLRVGLGVVHTTDDLRALGTEPDDPSAAATAVERHLSQVWGLSLGATARTALVQVGVERVRYVETLAGTTLEAQRPMWVGASVGVWR